MNFRTLPLLFLLAFTIAVQAQFSYTTNDGAITITGYAGQGGDLTIPSRINGRPVICIGSFAFASRKQITSVTIPDTVASLEDGVFYSCISLTSVTIPNSVTNIGANAFVQCVNLTGIGIPSSVRSIGYNAFEHTPRLTWIDVDALNMVYSSVGGVLFDKALTNLIAYPSGGGSSYTIPDSVNRIGDAAFRNCENLENVILDKQLRQIGANAFEGCFQLNNVAIPDRVTAIGEMAFYYCSGLTSLTLGNNLNSIGNAAFAFCNPFSIALPNSLTNTGDQVFVNCVNLTNVTIPESVTSIGSQAFSSCIRLTSIAIPGSVTSIGIAAFEGTGLATLMLPSRLVDLELGVFNSCTNLTTLTIPNSVITIEDQAFQYCTGLTNITIGNRVRSIGNSAFRECPGLMKVTIPHSVKNIGYQALGYCTNLTGVYFEGSAPGLPTGSDVFIGDNLTVYYVPGTTGWGPTFGGRPTALWVLPNPLILNNGPSFGVQTNGFGFNISWATNASVVVEASTNLGNSSWIPVATNTLGNGSSYFNDPQWTNYPGRFYRVHSL